MNYKEAKELIKSILNDVHYTEPNGEEYYPFDEKKIIQMMSDIRQEEDFESQEVSIKEAETYLGESIVV